MRICPKEISFFKLRGSVAEVKGGFTQATIGSAYQQVTGISTGSLLGYGTELISSYDGPSYQNQNKASYQTYYNGTPSVAYSTLLANPAIKPYNRLSYEAGADIKFLNNRLGLDATYFNTENGPQIFPQGLAPSTVYTAINENNVTTKRYGFEIALNGSAFKNPNGFSWDINVNYSTFKENHQ